jgi:hypothetical protein
VSTTFVCRCKCQPRSSTINGRLSVANARVSTIRLSWAGPRSSSVNPQLVFVLDAKRHRCVLYRCEWQPRVWAERAPSRANRNHSHVCAVPSEVRTSVFAMTAATNGRQTDRIPSTAKVKQQKIPSLAVVKDVWLAWLQSNSSQRHFQPRLGRATVVASYFDHLQAPTRCAPILGSSSDAHLEIYFSY